TSVVIIPNVNTADAGIYTVVVSGTCGSVTNSATLTVNQAVVIVSAPQNQTKCPGTSATFSVSATGTGLNYQWYRGISVLSGQTSNILLLPSVSAADAGTYSVVVSGSCNSVTNTVSLTLNQDVVIVSAPINQTTCAGTSASFSVSATGT